MPAGYGLVRRGNGEDRAARAPDDVLGGRAEDEAVERIPAVHAQHDHVRLTLRRDAQNLFVRLAARQHGLDLASGRQAVRCQLLQLRPAGFLEAVFVAGDVERRPDHRVVADRHRFHHVQQREPPGSVAGERVRMFERACRVLREVHRAQNTAERLGGRGDDIPRVRRDDEHRHPGGAQGPLGDGAKEQVIEAGASVCAHHHEIRRRLGRLHEDLLVNRRRFGRFVMDGNINRMLCRRKIAAVPRAPASRSTASKPNGPGPSGPYGSAGTSTGDRQHVQDGDVGAIAARDRHRPAEGVARELREIDRTENVLDVDHDHLQSAC